jgi:hypothetical protein
MLINSPNKSFVNGGVTLGFEVYIANGKNNRVFASAENGVTGNFAACPGDAGVGMGNLDLEQVVCFDAELCESHLRTVGTTAGILNREIAGRSKFGWPAGFFVRIFFQRKLCAE